MTPLRPQRIAALQRSGQSERTQQPSLRAVRLLAQFDGTSPALISAHPRQPNVLQRKKRDGLAPSARRLGCSAL
jgi:hypothetical protein